MPLLGWVCIGLVVLVGLLAVAFYLYVLFKDRQEFQEYAAKGKRVKGWIVLANTVLHNPNAHGDNVAQVLISFGEPSDELDEELSDLARRMAELYRGTPANPDEEFVAERVRDIGYAPYERHLLPSGFTSGLEVYSMHVWVERKRLPGNRLRLPYLRCLAIADNPLRRLVHNDYTAADRELMRRE